VLALFLAGNLGRLRHRTNQVEALFFPFGAVAGPTFAQKIAGNHLMYRSDGKYIFKTYRTLKSFMLSLMCFPCMFDGQALLFQISQDKFAFRCDEHERQTYSYA